MSNQEWRKKAERLIEEIVSLKEIAKNAEIDLVDKKEKLVKILEEHKMEEFSCSKGKCNMVRFQREGLIKDEVVMAVKRVNEGTLKQIEMSNLFKKNPVAFLNVRATEQEV